MPYLYESRGKLGNYATEACPIRSDVDHHFASGLSTLALALTECQPLHTVGVGTRSLRVLIPREAFAGTATTVHAQPDGPQPIWYRTQRRARVGLYQAA